MKRTLLLVLALQLATLTSLWAQPKVIAHRGYWRAEGSTQNSVSSLTRAAELGAYGAEFDVWYTADNQLILFHDSKFGGTEVEQLNAADMVGTPLPNGEPLPTLDEYLTEALRHPNIRIILEYKTHHNSKERQWEGAEAIVRKVAEYGLQERTDYIAFSLEACRGLVHHAPDAKVYYLNGDLSPRKLKEEGFAGADYYKLILLDVNKGFTKKAHRLGLEVNVWTVNKEDELLKAAELGLDYVTTDYPELAIELYKKLAK